jgi:hypothetical protein
MVEIRKFFIESGFSPIDPESYSLFRQYDGDSVLHERSASLVAAWSSASMGLFRLLNGWLCAVYFFPQYPVHFIIYSPLSPLHVTGTAAEPPRQGLKPVIDALYSLSRQAGLPSLLIGYLEKRFLPEYEGVSGYDIETEYIEEDDEYVLGVENFLNLSGNINSNKRERLKRCFKNSDFSHTPIDRSNIALCMDIEKEWCSRRDCLVCRSALGCEKKALEKLIHFFDPGIHCGILLYEKNVPVGFGIGEARNKTIGFAYMAKSLMQNCLVYILHILTTVFFKDCMYINLDNDMGIQGLKTFKSHLGVYELWHRYSCNYLKSGANG